MNLGLILQKKNLLKMFKMENLRHFYNFFILFYIFFDQPKIVGGKSQSFTLIILSGTDSNKLVHNLAMLQQIC